MEQMPSQQPSASNINAATSETEKARTAILGSQDPTVAAQGLCDLDDLSEDEIGLLVSRVLASDDNKVIGLILNSKVRRKLSKGMWERVWFVWSYAGMPKHKRLA